MKKWVVIRVNDSGEPCVECWDSVDNTAPAEMYTRQGDTWVCRAGDDEYPLLDDMSDRETHGIEHQMVDDLNGLVEHAAGWATGMTRRV